MSNCPVPGCAWTNIYSKCQDGSADAARYYHLRDEHPGHAQEDHCDSCGAELDPIEEGHELWDTYESHILKYRSMDHKTDSRGRVTAGPEYTMYPATCSLHRVRSAKIHTTNAPLCSVCNQPHDRPPYYEHQGWFVWQYQEHLCVCHSHCLVRAINEGE